MLEERARVAVNLRRRTRFACLGRFKTLDRFDWNHPERIDRALIERLVELEFVDRGENDLLKGGSGLGKTMIAQNLAQSLDGSATCRVTLALLTSSTTSSAGATSSARPFITSNLGFKQWGTTFPGAACVVALVDRFGQNYYRVEILGES